MFEHIIFCFIVFAFIIWREVIFVRERRELVDRLTAREQDFLDRLMAKDLQDVKRAQSPMTEPRAVTRRQNDARISEEMRRIAQGRNETSSESGFIV